MKLQRYEPDLDPARPLAPTWTDYTDWLRGAWTEVLTGRGGEGAVHRFLEANPCLLPGATDDIGDGGHHGVAWDCVITQPQLKGLGRNRHPDFIWLRRDTVAVRPICIEIEDPAKVWFRLDQSPHARLTQALDQLIDWKLWFQSPINELVFRQRYVPAEFRDRTLIPQFVLIYGRDAEFRPGGRHKAPETVRRKRDLVARDDEHLYTFDMLRPESDACNYGTLRAHPDSFELVALPPTYTTGPETRTLAATIASPEAALAETPLISPERRAYLVRRWAHWRDTLTQKGLPVTYGDWGE